MHLILWLKANSYTDSNKFKRAMNVHLMAISNVKYKVTSSQMENNYQHSKWFSLNTCFQCSIFSVAQYLQWKKERRKEWMDNGARRRVYRNTECIHNHFLFNWYSKIFTFIVHRKLTILWHLNHDKWKNITTSWQFYCLFILSKWYTVRIAQTEHMAYRAHSMMLWVLLNWKNVIRHISWLAIHSGVLSTVTAK